MQGGMLCVLLGFHAYLGCCVQLGTFDWMLQKRINRFVLYSWALLNVPWRYGAVFCRHQRARYDVEIGEEHSETDGENAVSAAKLRQKQREDFERRLSAGKKVPRGLSVAPSFRSNDSDSFRDVAPHQEFDLEHFGSGDLEPVALQCGQDQTSQKGGRSEKGPPVQAALETARGTLHSLLLGVASGDSVADTAHQSSDSEQDQVLVSRPRMRKTDLLKKTLSTNRVLPMTGPREDDQTVHVQTRCSSARHEGGSCRSLLVTISYDP